MSPIKFSKKPTFVYRLLLITVTSFLLLHIGFAQKARKKVLLINSYHIGYQWTDSITNNIMSEFNQSEAVDLFIENLDGKRYEDNAYFEKLFQTYQIKYKKDMFDLIILSDNLALEFSLAYGHLLYSGVPVVYCGINNPQDYDLSKIPYYGILETHADESVLTQISSMQSALKKIYIISDKTKNGVTEMRRIKKITDRLSKNTQYIFIDDIDMDSLFLKVKTIAKTDAILLIGLHRDKYGTPIKYELATKELCSISPAPVFCNYLSNIGNGVIGGSFVTGGYLGRKSAETALNILFTKGYTPQKVFVPKPQYYFDYHVLEQFNIPIESIPKGSNIINYPESTYNKYKKELWFTIILIVLLFIIIGVLSINILRRRKAEQIVIKQLKEIQEQNDLILNINQKLNNTISELENSNKKLLTLNNVLVITKEKAEESERLKSAFLANMSHEIRTPMNGILGFADLLKDANISGEKQIEYIEIINKSGARMLNIINDIIDISKIESGLTKLYLNQSNINDQISYIYSFFKPEAHFKNIQLSFVNNLPDNKAIINTDREKVYAIMTNLVKNAIKYTNKGSIEIGYELKQATSKDPFLQFYVKDTGIGIPTNRQSAIFERFVQADITDKMALQGAGLGLAISKAYVKMLNGEIWVESEEGKGSTFYFTLPYNPHQEISTHEFQSPFSEKTDIFKKLKVLIAEDDKPSEILLTILVDPFCKEIMNVQTGLDAVKVCRKNTDIDLILMDLQMSEMGGCEATKQIRKFNNDVIIIAQSAYSLLGDKEKAIEAGCNDYIAKPINKRELHALIHKYFEQKLNAENER